MLYIGPKQAYNTYVINSLAVLLAHDFVKLSLKIGLSPEDEKHSGWRHLKINDGALESV